EPGSPLGLQGGEMLEVARHANIQEGLKQLSGELSWLSAIIDVTFDRITAANGLKFHDRHLLGGKSGFTATEVSEGVLYALFMILVAQLDSAPPFFSVENADHGLHPRLARQLMSKFCDWIIASPRAPQCVLTTQ